MTSFDSAGPTSSGEIFTGRIILMKSLDGLEEGILSFQRNAPIAYLDNWMSRVCPFIGARNAFFPTLYAPVVVSSAIAWPPFITLTYVSVMYQYLLELTG
jgi:hypothetical protein